MRKDLPLIFDGDVIVNGGELAGVAAACAAAAGGARVFLAIAETYAGADICATGRLWAGRNGTPATPLARKLFCGSSGQPLPHVRPLDFKRQLDEVLLESGVCFIFGATPADLLLDGNGQVAGMTFATRNGRFAVRGRAIVDASFTARAARAAGLAFSSAPRCQMLFRQVVLGHRAPGDTGRRGVSLGMVAGPTGAAPVEAFEYSFKYTVKEWTPTCLAAIEQRIRNKVWHRDQNWFADRPWFIPGTQLKSTAPVTSLQGTKPFATTIAGLWVAGPCIRVTRRLAEKLTAPYTALAVGERLGQAAAAYAAAVHSSGAPCLAGQAADGAVKEPCTCDRFNDKAGKTIADHGPGRLPELGSYDVVVAGGGTGGAPAAIAAARAGARVLLVETLPELGGVGTVGMISTYWYGYREGFTAEITAKLAEMSSDRPCKPHSWVPTYKSELLRREVLAAGGEIWFGSTISGAVAAYRRVSGVVVNTPWGRGVVRAGMVIDATGNADVAAAAGAPTTVVSTADLAIQGTGLALRPWQPTYYNTDYTFADDADIIDSTRVFVMARRKYADAFDLTQLIDSRERRQIVGDVTVTAGDVYRGRTWRDTICHSHSNFDSHGFTVDPLFLVEPPDHEGIDAWLPLRALLPREWDGLLVTGLGISGQRDVMPVLRMQPDIQNHAYAAGLAAVMALRHAAGHIRAIDIRALQRKLVQTRRLIPGSVLLHGDMPAGAMAPQVVSAASGTLTMHAEIAALMATPALAIPLLKERLTGEIDKGTRIRCAKLLAVLGDSSGEDILMKAVHGSWDKGWDYTGMGQFGRSLSPQDDCIIALGLIASTRARAAILRKAATLKPTDAFSHFRAVALYCERLGGKDCARVLARLLDLAGVAGHDWPDIAAELRNIPESTVDNTTRNAALRELYLARALLACGDINGRGRAILQRYSHDIRGHFARHASALLASQIS